MRILEKEVVEILKKNNIDYVASLPCDRIKTLLPLIEKNINTIALTREENGIGISAGIYLGGGKPAMVIQSTGIGNMINALESLNLTYKIPLPILASWRGVYNEGIEAQIPLGKKLPQILKACDIKYTIVEKKDEIDKIDFAIKYSFEKKVPYVVLISPKIWENSLKETPIPLEICQRKTILNYDKEIKKPILTRYEAIEVIANIVDNEIILSNLGIPSKELYQIKDRELNFYMLGSMGLVSSIGLGLSLIQSNHVYVIDGDGSILMNPNSLFNIGTYNPENLTIIAIDNAAYGSTGNQKTCSCSQIDLELLAKSSGIKDTVKVHTKHELKKALLEKKSFIHTIVKPINKKCENIPYSANEIKERFMKSVYETKRNLFKS